MKVCLIFFLPKCSSEKLYHLGFTQGVKRSTLADANESRDYRIYEALAYKLIVKARKLYQHSPTEIELEHIVYALDSTTIELCLNVFWWARFRKHKAAVKLHTLLDLKCEIPCFIHISDGKYHDVNVLNILEFEPDAFYVMDRGYTDWSGLYKIHQSGAFFVIRAKKNLSCERIYSRQVDKSTGLRCDQTVRLKGHYASKNYPEKLRRVKFYDDEHQVQYVYLTNHFEATPMQNSDSIFESLESGNFLQMDQTTFTYQTVLGRNAQRCQNSNMDCCVHLCARSYS